MAMDLIRAFIFGPLFMVWAIPVCIVIYIYIHRNGNKITSMAQIIDISNGIYPEGVEPTHDGSEIGARIRMADGSLREYQPPRAMGNTGLRVRK